MNTSKKSDPFSFKFNIPDYETYDYGLEYDAEAMSPLYGEDCKLTFNFDSDIDYAFNEKALLEEMKEYIDSTYDAHYSQDKYQSTEIIEDMGHGMGFALGNVIKYCQRYGKKDGFNRNDLKKVIHYGIIALAMHDKKNKDKFEYPLPNQD